MEGWTRLPSALNRVNLRTKLLIATVVLSIVPLAATGAYIFFVVPHHLQREAESGLLRDVARVQSSLEHHLRGPLQDLAFIRDSPWLRRLVDEDLDASARERVRSTLAEQWRVFARSKEIYDQIRYIDPSGQEQVRVDWDGEQAVATLPGELQNKADRYYFVQAMELDPGDTYVSPIDLNREHGEIETPHQPVVRYAAPVFYESGEQAGIVVLNMDASGLLAAARNEGSGGRARFLIDEDGFYLSHPERSKAWGGPSDLGHGARLAGDYPGLAWTPHDEVAAAVPALQPHDTDLVATAPVAPPGGGTERWTLVTTVPKDVILAPVQRYKLAFGAVAGTVLLLVAGLDFLVARRLMHPLDRLYQGVRTVGRGDLGYRIDVRSGDEVQSISQEFNSMAAQLQEAHATLEERVQQATDSLNRRNRQLRSLYETGVELVSELSSETLLQKITDASCRVVQARHGALGVLDEDRKIGQFHVSGVQMAGRNRIGKAPGAAGMFRILLEEGRPVRLDDVSAHPEFSGFPEHHPAIRSFLGVPIVAKGRVIGDLYVGNKAAESEVFTDDDEEMLTLLASLAAVAIENARLLSREEATITQLRELDELKSDFVDTVSHELRTPIATIRGYLELLSTREGDLTTEHKRQLLSSVQVEAAHLTELVEDVLTTSRIDSGHRGYAMRPLALDALVREVVHEAGARAAGRSLLLDQGGEVVVIRGDEGLLRQALLNLVDNALKFSLEGRPVTVGVGVDGRSSNARVTVADEGVGIAAEDIPKLFRKFSRVRNEAPRRVSGTGLGLYIARNIVEAHGGRISVASEPAVGSTFTVVLPVQRVE